MSTCKYMCIQCGVGPSASLPPSLSPSLERWQWMRSLERRCWNLEELCYNRHPVQHVWKVRVSMVTKAAKMTPAVRKRLCEVSQLSFLSPPLYQQGGFTPLRRKTLMILNKLRREEKLSGRERRELLTDWRGPFWRRS